jgi:CheY-like chemotaxis protein
MFSLAAQKELPVVLLIDDDLVSREVTATVLTMDGYTVHTADTGTAALKMLAKGAVEPGVVLMDAQMPGLSGAKLIGKIRAHSNAPIYAVSGSQPPNEIASAADGFLLKPFTAEALGKLLNHQKLGDHKLNGRKTDTALSLLDPNDPVVSTEILTQFRTMMPESAVRQIYTAVVSDLSGRIEALGAAIAKGDAAEVRRIGHAIKGGCGMAGAMQAAHLGALLEASPLDPKDNQLDNSAALLRDLRDAALGLKRMLDAELPA